MSIPLGMGYKITVDMTSFEKVIKLLDRLLQREIVISETTTATQIKIACKSGRTIVVTKKDTGARDYTVEFDRRIE